ncbi:hypothetical protein CMV30_11320 [Nibricoccus aquaticus]|uniref:Band 7 domain-containing protein n=1 Tax=Nibricoccus aquaticus TaxID=2576891 RepID=A0A290QE17_9BACT|nr:protease modulator HflK [Nibricoccus aquaticus]ATC64496.1 hypothetical protein CMV30_11320 [Nibricoccus aquaticus]
MFPALFSLLLAATATAAALLQPSLLLTALAAWTTWSAFVALNVIIGQTRTRAWARAALLPTGAAATFFIVIHPLIFRGSPSLSFSQLSSLNAQPAFLLPLLILGAFAGFFLQTYATLRARTPGARDWSAPLSAALLKLQTIVFAFTAALVFASNHFDLPLLTLWSQALIALTAFWILETFARYIARLYQPRRFALERPPLGCSWLLLPFLAITARNAWLAPVKTDGPVIALADMWFLPTLRRLALPLVAVAAVIIWAGTSLHEIPPGHTGLHARFGRMDATPLTPGLHVTLPFPFHSVTVLPADRLQSIVLGFASDTGQPILWDRGHYIGEQSQLVGHGDDLLTISVPVYYYIRDPLAYHRHTGDAAAVIRDLASQQLLAHTQNRSAFEIMTTGRDELAHTILRDLQSSLDRRNSGLAVALVCLRDIHPPVAVGPAYQEVVSAIEDREAARHEGEDYRAENLPRARSDSAQVRANADTLAGTRSARVRGEAARFDALLASYQASPEVFRIRQSYAAYDESLRGVKKLIVDEKFRGRLPTFVDARKTLNPDFAPPPVPDNPGLIPIPSTKQNAFDRAIDGYLNMGRGAIPAAPAATQDSDNLMSPRP